MKRKRQRHVVIGGGISGVSCAQELCRIAPDDEVTLISSSAVVQVAENVRQVTKLAEDFDVVERGLGELHARNLVVREARVSSLDTAGQEVVLFTGERLPYDKLCVATGARPRMVAEHPRVLALRDAQSVDELVARVQGAERVLLVGNGGIALTLAHALRGVEVVWALKHAAIGDAFFDTDAARFLAEALAHSRGEGGPGHAPRQVGGAQEAGAGEGQGEPPGPAGKEPAVTLERRGKPFGHAVGPDWVKAIRGIGAPPEGGAEGGGEGEGGKLRMVFEATLAGLHDEPPPGAGGAGLGSWPVYAQLSDGEVVGADLVVSAAGVEPNSEWLGGALDLAEDGGVLVDAELLSSAPHVHAAGDVCTLPHARERPQWFQMRLWTQGRVMGMYAAHCMCGVADELALGFNFELFTHVTKFLGLKVVLLGLYNGQHLEEEAEEDVVTYVRSTGGGEGRAATFVRVLLARGRMQGAVLIGETGLEETFENLILNGIDLSVYGPELLDPEIDLEDYFD